MSNSPLQQNTNNTLLYSRKFQCRKCYCLSFKENIFECDTSDFDRNTKKINKAAKLNHKNKQTTINLFNYVAVNLYWFLF